MEKTRTELMDTWVGKTLIGVLGSTCALAVVIGGALLSKMDQLHDDVVTIKTQMPYMVRDISNITDAQKQNYTDHLSFQAQFSDLREMNYRHGWR